MQILVVDSSLTINETICVPKEKNMNWIKPQQKILAVHTYTVFPEQDP